MKRIFRASIALLLLAALFVGIPAAMAQDTFGLSQDDFATWTGAFANTASFSTLKMDYTSTLNLAGLGADVMWDVRGTAWIDTVNGALAMTVLGMLNDGSSMQDIDMEVRIVGDMFYVTFDGGMSWEGGRLEDAAGAFAGGAGINPDDLMSGDVSGLLPEGMDDALAGFGDFDPAAFVSVARAGSDFTISLDIPGLLSSPAIAGLLGGALGGGGEMTAQQQQQMGMMMGMMFADARLTYTQSVNTGSNLVERGAFLLSLPLDALVGEGALVTLTMDFDFNGWNAPVTIEAPANFEQMETPALPGM
jgi:hypothetical protein